MASQTAIDYGSRRVRLLEFDGSGKKLRVLNVADVSLDVAPERAPDEGDRDEAAAAAEDAKAVLIGEAVRAEDFETDPCGMAFDGSSAMVREFNLPFTNDDQIAKVIRFEAESHIPMDIDDVVMQHVVLRKTRDKSHVLVTAVKTDDLLDRLENLQTAGLDPLFVDAAEFALFNAVVGLGLADRHEAFAVLDIQERTTSLLIVQDGKLHAVRAIRLGTHGLHPTGGGSEEEAIDTARLHDVLARLQRELRRTLSTMPGTDAIEHVYLLGAGSRVDGVPKLVEEAFGAESELLNPLEHVTHALPDDVVQRIGPDLGVALGVAFKLNGVEQMPTDFRRNEAAYTRKFDQVKSPLIALSFLAFLAVCFLAITAVNEVRRLELEYKHLLAHAQQQLREVVGDNDAADALWQRADFGPDQVRAISTAMADLVEEKKSQLGRSDRIPELRSALEVWIVFFDLLQENEEEIGRFAMERVDVDLNLRTPMLKLSGQLEDASRYEAMIQILERHPMFAEVLDRGYKQVIGGIRFSDLQVELDMNATDGTGKLVGAGET